VNNIVLTTLLGFVAGCAGVVFAKLVVEPYLEYRRVIRDISHALVFHAGLIISAPFPQRDDSVWSREEYEKAREEHLSVSRAIRDLAARLKAAAMPLLQSVHMMPSRKTLNDAAGRLIRISNAMLDSRKKIEWLNGDMEKVAELLGLDLKTG
jgi:hypothetical protein